MGLLLLYLLFGHSHRQPGPRGPLLAPLLGVMVVCGLVGVPFGWLWLPLGWLVAGGLFLVLGGETCLRWLYGPRRVAPGVTAEARVRSRQRRARRAVRGRHGPDPHGVPDPRGATVSSPETVRRAVGDDVARRARNVANANTQLDEMQRFGEVVSYEHRQEESRSSPGIAVDVWTIRFAATQANGEIEFRMPFTQVQSLLRGWRCGRRHPHPA